MMIPDVQDTPENSLILPKWTGDNSDRSLITLAQFLQEIGSSDVDDVREVLTYYRQFPDPIEAFRCDLLLLLPLLTKFQGKPAATGGD